MLESHVLYCYFLINKLKGYENLLIKILKVFLIKYYGFILKYFFGSFISHEARLGNGIKFPHSFHGIFISQSARIGNNVTILHGVTIGSNISKPDGVYEAPIIGDHVFIGCNALIIGRSIVGERARIGAGAVIVNREIPASSVAYNLGLVVGEKKC